MVPSRVYDAVANHDPDEDSDGTSITVSKDGPVDPPPANQSPDASFSYDCTDLTCSFDASESSDLDGSIASYVWDFGDEGDPVSVSEETITHGYAEQRAYEVVLTVVDDLGATGEDRQTVDLDGGSGGPTMHVGDLEGQSKWVRNKWQATVTITVLGADDSPVAGAEVIGDWGSCDQPTGIGGQCTITKGGISAKTPSVNFTVSDVSHPGYTYDSGENRDLDGDSTGTSIAIERPSQE
jgi:PKD repeat protein